MLLEDSRDLVATDDLRTLLVSNGVEEQVPVRPVVARANSSDSVSVARGAAKAERFLE